MKLRNKLDQVGAASMMSVAIFSIIITIVVTAYLRSAVSQLAQSNNYDFSTRAFYSAESGIQDALRHLNTDPAGVLGKDDCDNFVPTGATGPNDGFINKDLGLSYTCQLIDTTPGYIAFDVSENNNATVRLRPANTSNVTDSYTLVVRWSPKENISGLADRVGRSPESQLFTPQIQWKSLNDEELHAALRLSIMSTPLNSLNIEQRVLFLNPIADGPGAVTLTKAESNQETIKQQAVQSAKCVESADTFGGYYCQQTIELTGYQLDNHVLYVRTHSLYASTNVQLSLIQNNSQVPLAGSAVQVDVTGKAADTLRRVRQTFNMNNGVMIDNLPEAAVIGGNGICKHYEITDDEVDFKNLSDCAN